MTRLQQSVIDRLRKAGYDGQADAAQDAWPHGEAVQMPNMVDRREARLRADFEKANSQPQH